MPRRKKVLTEQELAEKRLANLRRNSRNQQAYAKRILTTLSPKVLEARRQRKNYLQNKHRSDAAALSPDALRKYDYRPGRYRSYYAGKDEKSFRTILNENTLFASINAVVPRYFDWHAREDITSTIMLAVLEGELAEKDIAAKAGSYIKDYNRSYSVFNTDSIDAVMPGMDKLRIIDTLVAPEPYTEYEQ